MGVSYVPNIKHSATILKKEKVFNIDKYTIKEYFN